MEPVPISSSAPAFAIDPVCGMRVAIEGAQHSTVHDGVTYYFCAKGCRLDFEDEPDRFLAPEYQPSMDGH